MKKNHKHCPVCNSLNKKESNFDAVIKKSLENLEHKLDGVGRSKPRVRLYVGQLEKEKSDLVLRLKRVKLSINKIREMDHELVQYADLNIQRARVAGKVSLYIESVDWNKDTSN